MKKKFIKIIAMGLATICAVFTLGACDGAFATVDGWLDNVFGETPAMDSSAGDNGDTDNGTDTSDNGTGDKVDVETPLVEPSNASELKMSGLAYAGSSLMFGEEDKVSFNFCVTVSESLVEHLKEERAMRLGVVYAPLEVFEAVNKNHYTVIDWVSELSHNATIKYFSPKAGSNNITSNVLTWQQYGVEYVCIPFAETNYGTESDYQYGTMYGTYRDNAISPAYAASRYLNDISNGEGEEVRYKKVINGAVDYANGLLTVVEDNSMPILEIASTIELKVGDNTYAINPVFKPNVKLYTLYTSSSVGVVTVGYQTGEITAKSAGTAKITVLVAGEEYVVTVTVTE